MPPTFGILCPLALLLTHASAECFDGNEGVCAVQSEGRGRRSGDGEVDASALLQIASSDRHYPDVFTCKYAGATEGERVEHLKASSPCRADIRSQLPRLIATAEVDVYIIHGPLGWIMMAYYEFPPAAEWLFRNAPGAQHFGLLFRGADFEFSIGLFMTGDDDGVAFTDFIRGGKRLTAWYPRPCHWPFSYLPSYTKTYVATVDGRIVNSLLDWVVSDEEQSREHYTFYSLANQGAINKDLIEYLEENMCGSFVRRALLQMLSLGAKLNPHQLLCKTFVPVLATGPPVLAQHPLPQDEGMQELEEIFEETISAVKELFEGKDPTQMMNSLSAMSPQAVAKSLTSHGTSTSQATIWQAVDMEEVGKLIQSVMTEFFHLRLSSVHRMVFTDGFNQTWWYEPKYPYIMPDLGLDSFQRMLLPSQSKDDAVFGECKVFADKLWDDWKKLQEGEPVPDGICN